MLERSQRKDESALVLAIIHLLFAILSPPFYIFSLRLTADFDALYRRDSWPLASIWVSQRGSTVEDLREGGEQVRALFLGCFPLRPLNLSYAFTKDLCSSYVDLLLHDCLLLDTDDHSFLSSQYQNIAMYMYVCLEVVTPPSPTPSYFIPLWLAYAPPTIL